ncbi:glycosyltransferase family 4 protein [Oceanihabitans sp.]|nr:glycosyltransferase family 4 protein [Oceanihabitans sp.]
MLKNLLIIGYVWPEPRSSAAGTRMLQIIDCFQTQEYEITFASPCAKSDHAIDLNTIGVIPVSIALNHSSFDEFIKALNPEVVLFDRFMMEEQFGWRVAEHCPNALRILDTEDLHSLRKGRQQAFKDRTLFDDRYLFNEMAKREVASIYRCDISLIISEAEMGFLKQRFKVDDDILYYLPFMLHKMPSEAINNLPKFEDRKHFITVGNFLHEPNYNAVLYLKETIWPLIRKRLPKAEMHIYGAYASQKVNQLHNEKEKFLIQGFAKDVNLVMQDARVCLAPIRFGAGLKGKLFDAMKNGTPCVTTSIGAEGVFGPFDINGFVEDNAQDFADKAVTLYNEEQIWKEKQSNGFQVINERFNKIEHQSGFIKRLNKVLTNIEAHRLQNFTGQMLWHQNMQSTKYMSKWIEEKNKN